MTTEDWNLGYARSLSVYLNGDVGPEASEAGGDSFLLLFNAGLDPTSFAIPEALAGDQWVVEVDTFAPDRIGVGIDAQEDFVVMAWALVVLRRPAKRESL